MSLQLLKDAIDRRKPISFRYKKSGKNPGERIGNTHAIWVMRKKDGTESTKVHIFQTDGVSDSGQELPSFRMFDLDTLSEVEILEDNESFEISELYNPEWKDYKCVIAKI